MRWDFFVRTYGDDAQQKRNAKFVAKEGGVLYPRAGTLGGCTAHNAMIDLSHSTTPTGTRSRGPSATRASARPTCAATSTGTARALATYAEAERDRPGAPNPSRHGFHGWLPTKQSPTPRLAIKESRPSADRRGRARRGRRDQAEPLSRGGQDDPRLGPRALGSKRLADRLGGAEGRSFLPMTTWSHGARSAAREYVRAVAATLCPDNLPTSSSTPSRPASSSTATPPPSASNTMKARASIAPPRAPTRAKTPASVGWCNPSRGHPRRRRLQLLRS